MTRRASSSPGSRHRGRHTSLGQLTERNVQAIVALEQAARASTTFSQRLARRVAAFCGSMSFVWLHALLFAAWIAWNVWPGTPHPDPYPFIFLTLMVSLEAIFLSTLILISQNDDARIAERRNALDLQINLLSEQENTKMLQLLAAIARKLEIPVDNDGALSELEQAMRPEKLAEQIDRAAEQGLSTDDSRP